MRNVRCLNCDQMGHTFQRCVQPIKSFGIIAYRYTYKIQYLMIQRRNTIGYIDFLRGRYKDLESLISLIEEMSNEERSLLLYEDFHTLWKKLWRNHSRGIYINEMEKAYGKYTKVDIHNIIQNTTKSRYDDPEWGFPKGRKNLHETHVECALREFEEETGFTQEDYTLNDKISPISETFTGSDGQKYTHIYYFAQIHSIKDLEKLKKTNIFLEEIRQVKFMDYAEAYKKIRKYDTQKRYTLSRVNSLFSSFEACV